MEYLQNSSLGLERLKRVKVWIVDDDVDLCEAYSDSLSEFFDIPFRTRDSRTALEALKQAKTSEIPNVIVLDRHMPGLDGLSFCKETLKLRLAIGFLLVSGDQSPLSEDEADQLDVFAMVQKPCSTDALCRAIYQHCAFQNLCARIADEILMLCRSSVLECDVFLGMHADIEKAFQMPVRKKASLIAAIQNAERKISGLDRPLPVQCRLPFLFEEFRFHHSMLDSK
jgi:DNA-binding NtrC family response regulator